MVQKVEIKEDHHLHPHLQALGQKDLILNSLENI